MENRKKYSTLIICYIMWGFQPLYWALFKDADSYTMLAMRIIFAAMFSLLLLAVTGRISELKVLFQSRETMKFLVPATVFLLADWTVFIIAVNNGHVLDASLGYYICPLVMFAIGTLIYKEKAKPMQLAALGAALLGVIYSTVSLGKLPAVSLVLALNWAIYASFKKNVKVDGVVSIAAETLILSPFALAFLLIFRRDAVTASGVSEWLLYAGSGIVTALPMFLYSNCVSALPLIVMCFAQYLSPSFNLICGFVMGESFSKPELISLAFFITAIVMFTCSQIKQSKKT